MKVMDEKKYVVNLMYDVSFIDSNTIYIKTLEKNFYMRGADISISVKKILEFFNRPTSFSEVISALFDKYSENTVMKMLSFLSDKKILIDKEEHDELAKHSSDLVNKAFFYTLGGKTFTEIVDELKPLRIGIIGARDIVHHLLNYFYGSGLIFEFNLGVTDTKVIGLSFEEYKGSISEYSLLSDLSDAVKIVKESDIIIAASNHHDHYLFNKINVLCLEMDKRWVRIMVNGSILKIGPLFIPNITCCYSCLHTRMQQNMREDEYEFDSIYLDSKCHDKYNRKAYKESLLYPLTNIAAGLACNEVLKHYVGMQCNILGQVFLIDGLNFKVQADRVYKDYSCSICS